MATQDQINAWYAGQRYAGRDEPPHLRPKERNHRRRSSSLKLLAIPDMRFEATYLRNIRPYLHLPEPSSHGASIHSSGDEKRLEGLHHDEPHHEVRIEWGKVAWVTTRDYILSPMMWGMGSHLLMRLGAIWLAPIREYWRGQSAKPVARPSEGRGAGWLRNWVKSLVGSGIGLTHRS
ncbi:hypothetical protein PUNSTDRAFT_120636 [Punctularia strigosozonata HHB-11173 SS5]|uniref:uncharacterized protein n=1 Tax=Punctularia strigosozonata (strain HHB-11173) TaxID=741275 RepID=UPI0004416532|nr:uncharacterized protein PUNSTDRAFT_120636 [Punctularia strigosozonata HHB-11173 SS5]EIN08180.1 hypothetical protein PUNSTDRAFT_120636 [Punctularia strigosozonata HHB-11173 SS5]